MHRRDRDRMTKHKRYARGALLVGLLGSAANGGDAIANHPHPDNKHIASLHYGTQDHSTQRGDDEQYCVESRSASISSAAAAELIRGVLLDATPSRRPSAEEIDAVLRTSPARPRRSFFVGRHDELAQLEQELRRVDEAGRGRVISVVGPSGIGKSAL
jgi:hypothetical protein